MSSHHDRAVRDIAEADFLSQFATSPEAAATQFVLRFQPLLFSLLHKFHPDTPRYSREVIVAETIRRVLADRARFRAGDLKQFRGHLHAVLRRVVAGLPTLEQRS